VAKKKRYFEKEKEIKRQCREDAKRRKYNREKRAYLIKIGKMPETPERGRG